MPEEDLKPNPRFLKAMHDPGHPDFGLSFSAAVELAMAKEKEAITLASTHGWWATDGDDAEATVENANGPDESAAGTPVENKAVTAVEDAAKPTAEPLRAGQADKRQRRLLCQLHHPARRAILRTRYCQRRASRRPHSRRRRPTLQASSRRRRRRS